MTPMSRPMEPDHDPGGLTRRHLLQASSLGLLGVGIGPRPPLAGSRPGRAVVLIQMVGGASPWETFDPQPAAPSTHRGPFAAIPTAIPGVRVAEHLPEIARRLDQLTLIRSVHHDGEPTHDAGLRLLRTGRSEPGYPPLGSVVAHALGSRGGMPPFIVLPDLVGPVEGVNRPRAPMQPGEPEVAPFVVRGVPGRGDWDPDRWLGRARRWGDGVARRGLIPLTGSWAGPTAGCRWDWDAERSAHQARFGTADFGRHCWLAGQFVAAGARLVVINMAQSPFDPSSWDAHGRAPFRSLTDQATTTLPAFDRGLTGLVDFLHSSGLADSTLVVATGEMGRTPWINEAGGRDHWPGVWSALVAGGGTPGGQVIGASDPAGRPRDRPVPLADLMASIARFLGLPESATSGQPVRDLVG